MNRTPAPIRADQCARVIEYVTANPWKTAPEIGTALGLGETAKTRLDELKRSGTVVRTPSATVSSRPWRWATTEHAKPTDYDAHQMPPFSGWPTACAHCGLTWHMGIRTIGECKPKSAAAPADPAAAKSPTVAVGSLSLDLVLNLSKALGAYLEQTASEHRTPQRQVVRDAHSALASALEEAGLG